LGERAGEGVSATALPYFSRCPFYISFTNPSAVFVYTTLFLKRGSTIRIHKREPIRRSIEETS
jgi:hypothetical protein